MLLNINHRLFSTIPRDIRVRFAPSPTGRLHFGGLRTAFYNYIFAKQNAGKFILRIEDTDQTRLVPGSSDDIEKTLNWAGLSPDESPTVGGQFGPYKQSERIHLYAEKADHLLKHGKAYRCFCSPARLELLRNYQLRNREKPRYDGKCSTLNSDQIREKIDETEGVFVIRFKLSTGFTLFKDMIFGDIKNNLVESMESDPIIIKSDKYPTYHFANVVDDHCMKISHVLRGSEWLSSTTKHAQIYQAFNWNPPTFAHFPLVTMQDGSKMSKRNEHNHVKYWRDSGYRPLAILNFLTNMGGGVPKSKQDSMDIWNLQTMIERFDFNDVTCHPGSADIDRLNKYNQKDLKRSWQLNPSEIVKQFKKLLQFQAVITDLDDENLKSIISHFVDRVVSLNELLTDDYKYLWGPPELTWESKLQDKSLVKELLVIFNEVDFEDKQAVISRLRELAVKTDKSFAYIMKFFRKLLTNSESGLPVHELCRLLGKERTLIYLENGLK